MWLTKKMQYYHSHHVDDTNSKNAVRLKKNSEEENFSPSQQNTEYENIYDETIQIFKGLQKGEKSTFQI